jgi:hypothetical protein
MPRLTKDRKKTSKEGVAIGPHHDAGPNRVVRYVMEAHGLTTTAMARTILVTPRAVGQWVQGIYPVPDWAQDRISRVHTALRVTAGEVADCVGLPGEGELPTPLQVMEHLGECVHCLTRAFQAVAAPAALALAMRAEPVNH